MGSSRESYLPPHSRPFAIHRSLILPLAILAILLFGILIHCGYHFLRHATILKPLLPSAITSLFPEPEPEAPLLYVASYAGNLSTWELANGELHFKESTNACGRSPSWLTMHSRGVLYCLDEGITTGVGGVAAFEVKEDGSLDFLVREDTFVGPVSSVPFGRVGDENGLAVAHYGGSAMTVWDIHDSSKVRNLRNVRFWLRKPGPDPSRQEAPHPHQAIADPTGRFILVPDLGADQIRIFFRDGSRFFRRAPLQATPGSGPRHVTFAVKGEKTFMYLVTELANTVVGYEVEYLRLKMDFKKIFEIDVHGEGQSSPKDVLASEVLVSPDSNFLIISSRNDDSLNTTSDPLINYAIDGETGHLSLLQQVPCGGRGPRQFSINRAGTLVAVGLQEDGRVVVLGRDVKTGLLGDIVASTDVEGEVTAVIFREGRGKGD